MEKPNNLLFFIYLFVMLLSCSSTVDKVNFLMDGKDFDPSESKPTDVSILKTITTGNQVYFTDESIPNENVKARFWNINDEFEIVEKKRFSHTFDQEGLIKITLCVNDKTNCVSKWINVITIGDLDFPPQVSFINPNEYSSESDKRKINVSAQTENVYTKDELKFLVEGKEKPFKFDEETGILTADNIRLSSGENEIEVQASTEEGDISASVFVAYNQNSSDDEKIKPKGKGAGGADPGFAGLPVVNLSSSKDFKSSRADVIVQTEKVKQKNLSFKLNGQSVSFTKHKKYKTSNLNKTDWTLALKLKEGINRLAYQATNNNGSLSEEFLLNYEQPVQIPDRPKPLKNKASVGIPTSQYNTFTKDCIALYTQDKFEIVLLPNKRLELQSFKVYTNICGGLKITLDGDGNRQTFNAALNAGSSNISFTPIDAELRANSSYTLTLEPLGNYKSCNASSAPRFEKVTDCDARSTNHAAIKVEQTRNPILYDLKIQYE